MLYYFGSPVKASGLSLNASGLYNADDTTIGQVLFPQDLLFSGTWCFTAAEKRDQWYIFGTTGSLHFSILDHQRLVLRQASGEITFNFDALPHVQQPMIQHVVAYFLNRGPNPCSAEDGVTIMRMMEAITGR
jgi:predicted dehydrogenase